jgi:Na+/H+ antiporter NhaD/arsenite permease-like protein
MKEVGEDINFKHWFGRTVMLSILLFTLVGVIDRYFGTEIFVVALITVTIMLIILFIHEGLHYYKAISLGYKPIWWRTRVRMGFDIETEDKTEERKKKDSVLSLKERKQNDVADIRRIAVFPYYFIIPLSFSLFILGFFFNIDALMYAGATSIILHLITYKKEGKVK